MIASFAQAASLLTNLAGITTANGLERSAEAARRHGHCRTARPDQAIFPGRLVPPSAPGPLRDILYLATDGTGDPDSTSELATLQPVEHSADLVQAEARRHAAALRPPAGAFPDRRLRLLGSLAVISAAAANPPVVLPPT